MQTQTSQAGLTEHKNNNTIALLICFTHSSQKQIFTL